MKIQSVNNLSLKKNNPTFKNKKNNHVQEYLKKYNYLDAKTKDLQDLSLTLFIISLCLDITNIDLSKKLSNKQKLGCLAGLGCIATIIATCIKKEKLSKQYDKEILV